MTQDAQDASDKSPEITLCIRMRGLPWASQESQVKAFFGPLQIVKVAFLYDRTGKPKGECFVRFQTDEMAREAMKMDRQYMGHRFVECYLTKTALADKAEAMSVDQTKDSVYVRLRGLPFSAKEGDIVLFLAEHGITAVEGSVVIEFGSDGRHSGCATVKLVSTKHADIAVSLHRNVRFGTRYVEIFKTTESDALQAEKTHGGAGAKDSFVVKLRGLPMTSGEEDVLEFLSGVKMAPRGIHMVDNDYGRANGTCFVQVKDSTDLDAALEKDGGQMGSRYIEVHRSTVAAMSDNHPPPQEADRGGPYVVWLRGLPFTVTGVDIVKQLFPDIDIVPQGVHLVLEDDGRSHGQAYVELSSERAMRDALSRTGKLMCKNYAQQASHTGRSIDVIPSTLADMRSGGEFVNEEVVVVKRRHPGECLGCQLDGVTLAGVADGSALVRHGGEQFVGRIIRRVNDIDITDPVCLSKALASNSTADTVTLRFQHVPYVPHPYAQRIRDILTRDPTNEWSRQWMRFCTSRGVSCDPTPTTIECAIPSVGEPPVYNETTSNSHPLVGCRINLAQRQRDVVAKIGKSIMQKGEYGDVQVEVDPIKYSTNTRLLLVGEGNFSYAASLCAHFGHAPNVAATGYDSEAVVIKLPNADSNIAAVKRCGSTLLHDVDATRLGDLREKLGDFDSIRWNNPHSGAYPTGAENVASNQCLLEAFLRSAVTILRPGGEIHIVSSQHSMKKWRIEEMGQPVVACVKIERHVNPFESYVSQRSRGGALPDAAHTVKIYTFRRASEIGNTKVIRSPVHQRPPTTMSKPKNAYPDTRQAPQPEQGSQNLVGSPIRYVARPNEEGGYSGYQGNQQGFYAQQGGQGYRQMQQGYQGVQYQMQDQPQTQQYQAQYQGTQISHPFLQLSPAPAQVVQQTRLPQTQHPQLAQQTGIQIGYQPQIQPQLIQLSQFGYHQQQQRQEQHEQPYLPLPQAPDFLANRWDKEQN